MKNRFRLIIVFFILLGACNERSKEYTNPPISHEIWNDFLQEFVTGKGVVNYTGININSEKLDNYIKLLATNHPNNTWNINQKKAYWINAYNAYAIKLIIDNYPVKSIKDTRPLGIPWYNNFIKIEQETYSLNDIEHNILRPKFKDARVHFAIVCASKSCPKLVRKAFNEDNLESLLDKNAREFINDRSKNKMNSDEVEISKIFDWFEEDFVMEEGDLINFLNRYSTVSLSKKTNIKYMDYDWSLNGK